jgi:RimJ/RimL family protein N-acetyltransferase
MARRPRFEALGDGVVSLRPWRSEDAAALVECIDGDPEITRWLDLIPQPYTAADARQYLDGLGEQAFAITAVPSGEILGSIGIRWTELGDVGEIGYWVRRDARGRGVATRALVIVSRWAIELEGVGRLQLRAAQDNLASRRVAEAAGFRLEGVLRAAHWSERQHRRLDWALYSLLPDDAA